MDDELMMAQQEAQEAAEILRKVASDTAILKVMLVLKSHEEEGVDQESFGKELIGLLNDKRGFDDEVAGEMSTKEMQRFLNQQKEDGKTEIEAYRNLLEIKGVKSPY